MKNLFFTRNAEAMDKIDVLLGMTSTIDEDSVSIRVV